MVHSGSRFSGASIGSLLIDIFEVILTVCDNAVCFNSIRSYYIIYVPPHNKPKISLHTCGKMSRNNYSCQYTASS